MTDRAQIEQSIATLEAQRSILGESVVDLALRALRQQLAEIDAQASQREEQRKFVSVLFADVPGLTDLAQTLDAEEIGNAYNNLWRRFDDIILAHGGHIDKHMGSSIMALWGIEQTREDDAERATRAALDMQTEVLQLFAAKDRSTEDIQSSTSLRVRVGINTGLVMLSAVASTQEYTAIGDTVNIANRLQTAAAPGVILISHDTYRQVRGKFNVIELAPIIVKGKKEPLQIYQVNSAKPRFFRQGSRGIEGVETRMIGREAELEQLKHTLLSVKQGDMCQMITITGDAGLGKSRLLHEFDLWLEVQPDWYYYFKGRASQETQNIPNSLLNDLFAFRFQLQDSDSPAVVRHKIEQGVMQALVDAGAAPAVAQLLAPSQAHLIGQFIGLDFSDSPHVRHLLGDARLLRTQAIAAISEYFKTLASHDLVLILLEDVHWADDSSLNIISQLAQTLNHERIIILCAARPTLFERRPLWGEGLDCYSRLELSPLSRRASLNLVKEILQKIEQIPDILSDLVIAHAEGNPFYMEELLKMFIDDGVIIKADDPHSPWTVSLDRLGTVHVPPTLTSLLQARFDSLTALERSVLQRASVIGRTFWDSAITYLGELDLSHAQVLSALAALRSREMIFQREEAAFIDTHEYIFKNTLLRDTIYENVLKRQRRRYHARAAEWLIAHSGERVGETAGLIADHLERAGQDTQAAIYLAQASEHALRVSALHEAAAFTRRALALLPAGSPERIPLDIQGGETLVNLGEHALARQYFEEGLALARQYGEDRHAATAQAHLGWSAQEQGQYDQARAWLDESLALARKVGDSTGIARALGNLGWLELRTGNFAQARLHLSESRKLYQALGHQRGMAHTLNGLGLVANNLGEHAEARTHFTEILNIYRQLGHRMGTAAVLNNLGETARLQGDHTTALAYYQEGLEIARQVGAQYLVAIQLDNLGHTAQALGDCAAAQQYHREGLKVAQTIDATPLALDNLAGLANILAHTGAPEQALEIIGVVMNHPSLLSDTQPVLETALTYLQERLSAQELETHLTHSRGQELDALLAKYL